MIKFPNIFIAPEFSMLLIENLRNTNQSNEILTKFINGRTSFRRLIQYSFQDIDKKARIDVIIKSLGWKNFRDRLASVYIHYLFDNSFPKQTNLALVQDLLDLENSLLPYIITHSSRTFLLSLYLKLGRIHLSKTKQDLSEFELTIPTHVLEIFKNTKMKVVEPDWAIIILWHFSDYLGEQVLDKLIDDKAIFEEIILLLSQEQQDLMWDNFLTYSYAINDFEFYQKQVN